MSRIAWRNSATGEFARAISLERAGEVRVCADKACGKVIVPEVEYIGGQRRVTFPENCPRCGRKWPND